MGDFEVGAWCFDRRSEVFSWSPELRAIYGEKPVAAQTGFEHFLLTTEPSDAEMVQQLSTRSFEDDPLLSIRYGIRLGDGTTRQLRLRGLAVQGADGRVERVVGVVQAVEEPREARTSPLIPTPGSIADEPGTFALDRKGGAAADAKHCGPHPDRSSILLIEDNDAVRALTRMILTNGGFEVFEASRGEDAVSRIRENPIRLRLAILDIVLPGCGGVDVAKVLWESNPDLPVLFLSGHEEADLGLPSRAVCDFLGKPFKAEALLASVLSLLSGASCIQTAPSH